MIYCHQNNLTDNDGLRGTFWPVKFWPPNFFMKSCLIYPIKHGEGKKSHLWAFWGSRGAKKPKSKNCHFWAKSWKLMYFIWWFFDEILWNFLVIFWQQTSVSSNMSLQIERIVESLVAICTFVFFVWRVIPSMSVEHSDVLETLATDFTFKLGTMTVTGTLDCSRSAWGRHWVLVMVIETCWWLKVWIRYES